MRSVDLDLVVHAGESHENALRVLRPDVDDASIRSWESIAPCLLLQCLIGAGEGIRGDDEVVRALGASFDSRWQIADEERAVGCARELVEGTLLLARPVKLRVDELGLLRKVLCGEPNRADGLNKCLMVRLRRVATED